MIVSSARLLSIIVIATALFHLQGCERRCMPMAQKHGWAYWASPLYDRCDYKLAYRGREVTGSFTLVTPFGTLRDIAAEEPGNDSGWQVIATRTSDDVPFTNEMIPPTAIASGFYASDGHGRLRGTPQSWVYITDVRMPGWVAPERLFNPAFTESQPWTPRRR